MIACIMTLTTDPRTTGFGQAPASPFGAGAAPAANPFGASTFGNAPAAAPAFGAPATGGLFGQVWLLYKGHGLK